MKTYTTILGCFPFVLLNGGCRTGTEVASDTQPSLPPAAVAADLHLCTPEQNQSFAHRTHAENKDFVFGVSEHADVDQAYDRAIADAMKTLDTRISTDVNTENREIHGGGRVVVEWRIEERVKLLIEQHKAGCTSEERCQTTKGRYRVWARCSRYTPREMALRSAIERLAKSLPTQATVMVLPPTDDQGSYNDYAFEAQGILQDRMKEVTLPTQKVALLPARDPEKGLGRPDELYRRFALSHVVSGVATTPGNSVAFRLSLQSVDGQKLDETQFELKLDPGDSAKLEAARGLFAQYEGFELASTSGNRRPVRVKLSATRFREGEISEIKIQLDEPAYVYVFSIYENGKALMLVPSVAMPENRFTAGQWYVLPNDSWTQAGYTLRVCPIPGASRNRERIKVIATSKPLSLDPGRFLLSGMAELREGPKGELREVNEAIRRLKDEGASVAAGEAQYEVVATSPPSPDCRPKR